MIIGLDIDGVIADFDAKVLEYVLLEDRKKRNAGIINPNASYITEGMFDWSKEEFRDFFRQYREEIVKNSQVIDGAIPFMNQLKMDGYQLVLITYRTDKMYQNPRQITEDWLEKHHIPYDKLVLSKSRDKSDECIKEQVDLYIDDSIWNCNKVLEKGIEVCLFQTRFVSKTELSSVNHWSDLYDFIIKMQKRK